MKTLGGTVRVGISGWNYPSWRGAYYPAGLPHRRELEYASRRFTSIEVNGSFYSLLRPASCAKWYEATPPDFVFALKGSRYITHMKRLGDIAAPLANFFASGVLELGDKLGPILWQLPPQMRFDKERLEGFFARLPRTHREASAMAKQHDHRLAGRASTAARAKGELRHAIEVRHQSFCDPVFVELLRAHRIALSVSDSAGQWPRLEDVTADFVYVRLHGDTELYASGYADPAMAAWARRVNAWRNGKESAGTVRIGPRPPPATHRDVYVYFDNDARVRAPFDAEHLAELTGGAPRGLMPDLAGKGEEPRTEWPAWKPPAPRDARRSADTLARRRKVA